LTTEQPGVRVVDKRGKLPAERVSFPDVLPVLPLQNAVLFPNLALPVLVGRERSLGLMEEVVGGDRLLAVVAARNPQEDGEPGPDGVYEVGTAARVAELLRLPTGAMQVALQGIARVRFAEWTQTDPFMRARLEPLAELPASERAQALLRTVLTSFRAVAELAPYIPPQFAVAAMNVRDPGDLADFLAANLNLESADRQALLEELNVEHRLETIDAYLRRERELLELSTKAQTELSADVQKMQREQLLRRQLEVIRRELGEADDRGGEVEELRERVEKAAMPEEPRKAADRELDKLSRMPRGSPEEVVTRNYLEWLTEFPWSIQTEDNLDLQHAKGVLDRDHYALDMAKDRILEYLAVQKLRAEGRSPILCFVGPPGVGKTSLGQSIARALGRKFVRMSLGGVRDEAEIRGHRRTYIGALPGRIVQGMRRAGSNNPVMMLDEIDKLGMDFRGDPSAALLEVLDPEQNVAFADHYMEVPVDLSHVLFICTANVLDPVPPALRDRMEIIDIPGYTEPDKLAIAKQYLVPRQLTENGLTAKRAGIADDALRRLIREYTYEAGVRSLERQIAGVLRKVAVDVAAGRATRKVNVKGRDLEAMIGPPRLRREVVSGPDEVGNVTGLAWTANGGDVLFVEATMVPGRGNLILTGSLGDVMKESAQAAMTYARSRSDAIGAEPGWHERYDIHIHVPAGAIPKDGPSAGVTMATALVSAIGNIPVRRRVAMTGEITLHGKVLPIGGLKEKIIAGHRAGVKTVVMPRDNEADLRDVPEFVLKDLRIVLVESIDEVLREALTKALPLKRPRLVSPAGAATVRPERATATTRK
jgi:ATP-dependent Lon protease